MQKYMCEDMFTPEGIPMTSPYECGIPGSPAGEITRPPQAREQSDQRKNSGERT